MGWTAPLRACALLVFVMRGTSVEAQSDATVTGAEEDVTLQATFLTGEIRVDGFLDESAWGTARPITAFTQREPDDYQNRDHGEPVQDT